MLSLPKKINLMSIAVGYRYNTFCKCVKEEENEVYYDEYDDVNKDDPYA